MITKNNKGEYALYDQGKLIGYEPVVQIQGVRVLRSMAPMLLKMIEAAQHDGVNLTLAAGLRTWEEQYNLRKQNEKPDLYLQWQVDSKLVDHETYLTKADSKYFRPATGKPGWSNHQDGKAYDFNVTGYPEVYKWLVANAGKFYFFRTVPSERWHWEYWPDNTDKFFKVPKNHATWDGLV